ncbi:CHAT domain-containing protein, partial [Streptomyces populi]
VLVHAALGRGFVPCFVVGDGEAHEPASITALLDETPEADVIAVGLRSVPTLRAPGANTVHMDSGPRSSAEVLELLGRPPRAATITAPDRPQAYGPALHLALGLSADLALEPSDGDLIRLTGHDGALLRTWQLTELLGTMLPAQPALSTSPDPTAPAAPAPPGDEIVICENAAAELLVCQAVGYAQVRGCPIAFIPEITADEPESGARSRDGVRLLQEQAEAAVPSTLRSPNARTLTVFTRHLPLHLTPLPHPDDHARHWLDRYAVAHVPGRLGSVLVPRLLRRQLQPTPSVSFGLIFDSLGAVTNTESTGYAGRLTRSLSHPVVLTGRDARRDVLESALQHLDTDLVLLIAHGRDDHLEDADNEVISASRIGGWRLRGQPVVFNNSCSSWTTSSRAFLTAGARAVIATLWPVANEVATHIAAQVGERLHDQDEPAVAELLHQAVADARERHREDLATQAAYVFIGLPQTAFHARPTLNQREALDLLTHTTTTLYQVFSAVAKEGRPKSATALRNAAFASLRERFAALLTPEELPAHLAPPLARLSVLDIDFLLARLDAALGRDLLRVLPPERHPQVVSQMDAILERALHELATWEQRHATHMRRDRGQDAQGRPAEDTSLIMLSADFVLTDVLPHAVALADLRRPESKERARQWLHMAAMLVTTPADVSPDHSITDEALIARLRAGIVQRTRTLWRRDGKDNDNTTEIDWLAQGTDKAELANRFGMVRTPLDEPDRAALFFKAARDLAEPGSAVWANATSNLADTLRRRDASGDAVLGHYRAALRLQVEQGDLRNASITEANLLRRAASTGTSLGRQFIPRALARARALKPE